MLKSLNLYLTEKCNLDCKYCFVPKKSKSIEEGIAKKAIRYYFKKLNPSKKAVINFFGGEPLIEYSLLRKLIIYSENLANTEKKQPHFNLSTNGILLSRKKMNWLKKHKVHILLSCDGNRETNNKYRITKKGEGSFKLLMENLPSIIKMAYPNLIVRMTVSPDTAKNFYKNILFLYNLGARKIAYGFFFESKWQEKNLLEYKKQLDKVIELWFKKIDSGKPLWVQPLQDFIKKLFYPSLRTHLFAHPCDNNRFSIGVDGKIYPCHRFTALKSFQIGAVNKDGVIFNIDSLKQYFSEKKELFDLYGEDAGCPAINIAMNKSILKPMPLFKKINKIHFALIKKNWKELPLSVQKKQYIKKLYKILRSKGFY